MGEEVAGPAMHRSSGCEVGKRHVCCCAASSQQFGEEDDAGFCEQGGDCVSESASAGGTGGEPQVAESRPDLSDGVEDKGGMEDREAGKREFEGSRVSAGRGCLMGSGAGIVREG